MWSDASAAPGATGVFGPPHAAEYSATMQIVSQFGQTRLIKCMSARCICGASTVEDAHANATRALQTECGASGPSALRKTAIALRARTALCSSTRLRTRTNGKARDRAKLRLLRGFTHASYACLFETHAGAAVARGKSRLSTCPVPTIYCRPTADSRTGNRIERNPFASNTREGTFVHERVFNAHGFVRGQKRGRGFDGKVVNTLRFAPPIYT
jgi:hypothetical protein